MMNISFFFNYNVPSSKEMGTEFIAGLVSTPIAALGGALIGYSCAKLSGFNTIQLTKLGVIWFVAEHAFMVLGRVLTKNRVLQAKIEVLGIILVSSLASQKLLEIGFLHYWMYFILAFKVVQIFDLLITARMPNTDS